VLKYLVTSKVRRRLLGLLWTDGKRGTASELASLAQVSFASAHAELKEMTRALLAISVIDGGREVYEANLAHPVAKALQELLVAGTGPSPGSDADDELRKALAGLGAPLRGVPKITVPADERMAVLARGAVLARRDPTLARCMPLCFWPLRDSLDVPAFADLASRAEDRHALGFFLELTGDLGGDRRLGGLAETLRDRRLTAQRDFFLSSPRGSLVREFPTAAKWGFRMNTDLESFRTLFEKFKRS
jgi:hypothetical protein